MNGIFANGKIPVVWEGGAPYIQIEGLLNFLAQGVETMSQNPLMDPMVPGTLAVLGGSIEDLLDYLYKEKIGDLP